MRVLIPSLSIRILISCSRGSGGLSRFASSIGRLPGSMRVRTLASTPRGALSGHTSMASFANSLSLLISHQVSNYDILLGILAFNISTNFIGVAMVFFGILCPQFSITQPISIAVPLNIYRFTSPFNLFAFHILLKDQLDVYFFCPIRNFKFLLILFDFFIS